MVEWYSLLSCGQMPAAGTSGARCACTAAASFLRVGQAGGRGGGGALTAVGCTPVWPGAALMPGMPSPSNLTCEKSLPFERTGPQLVTMVIWHELAACM